MNDTLWLTCIRINHKFILLRNMYKLLQWRGQITWLCGIEFFINRKYRVRCGGKGERNTSFSLLEYYMSEVHHFLPLRGDLPGSPSPNLKPFTWTKREQFGRFSLSSQISYKKTVTRNLDLGINLAKKIWHPQIYPTIMLRLQNMMSFWFFDFR